MTLITSLQDIRGYLQVSTCLAIVDSSNHISVKNRVFLDEHTQPFPHNLFCTGKFGLLRTISTDAN